MTRDDETRKSHESAAPSAAYRSSVPIRHLRKRELRALVADMRLRHEDEIAELLALVPPAERERRWIDCHKCSRTGTEYELRNRNCLGGEGCVLGLSVGGHPAEAVLVEALGNVRQALALVRGQRVVDLG